MTLPLSALFELPEGAPVEVENVAAGTLWFAVQANPYRVHLGLVRNDGRHWVGDLNPHTTEVDVVDGRHVVRHLDEDEEPER